MHRGDRQDAHFQGLGLDLDSDHVGHEPVAQGRVDLVVLSGVTRLRRSERRIGVQVGLAAEDARVPVHDAGDVAEEHRALGVIGHLELAVAQFELPGVALEHHRGRALEGLGHPVGAPSPRRSS